MERDVVVASTTLGQHRGKGVTMNEPPVATGKSEKLPKVEGAKDARISGASMCIGRQKDRKPALNLLEDTGAIFKQLKGKGNDSENLPFRLQPRLVTTSHCYWQLLWSRVHRRRDVRTY